MEEAIKCMDLEKIKNHGMTLEEFALISKCNGMFTEIFRPDLNEKETENKMMKYFIDTSLKSKITNQNNNNNSDRIEDNELRSTPECKYENKYGIISHSDRNNECKNTFDLKIKECNLDLFRTAIFATTRRENFFMITNTSRKILKQTGDGHFSPVAAYHNKSDNILVLDSARFKYNSMWFEINSVYEAFKVLDKATNLQRGFILASRYY
jgi:hypothetical protein